MKIFKNKITNRIYAIKNEEYDEAIKCGKTEASFFNTFDCYHYTIPFADMIYIEEDSDSNFPIY